MNRTRWTTLPVLLVATAALLGACSDDDADDDAASTTAPPTASTLSEADWVEQVNGLCTRQNAAIGEVVGTLFGGGEPTPDAMEEAHDQIVSLSTDLYDDLAALTPPTDLQDRVDAVLEALDEANDEVASQTGAEFFGTDDDPYADVSALAADLGLDACASPGS